MNMLKQYLNKNFDFLWNNKLFSGKIINVYENTHTNIPVLKVEVTKNALGFNKKFLFIDENKLIKHSCSTDNFLVPTR